jgi:NAD-dependent oxidoreductase involved in siderophore biosynthesis
MDGEEVEEEAAEEAPSILDAAEALEPASEKTEAPVKEAPAAEEEVVEEEVAEEAPAAEADYSSMTVAELKELLKAAGKPVSGKKADLITRLNE